MVLLFGISSFFANFRSLNMFITTFFNFVMFNELSLLFKYKESIS